jgi:hypothetical protein
MKAMVAQEVAQAKRDNDRTTQAIEVLNGKFDLFCRSQFGIKFRVARKPNTNTLRERKTAPFKSRMMVLQERWGTSLEKVIKARSTWNTRRDPTSQKSGSDISFSGPCFVFCISV